MGLVDKLAARLPGGGGGRPGFGNSNHGVRRKHPTVRAQGDESSFDLFGKAGAWTPAVWWDHFHFRWRIVARNSALDDPDRRERPLVLISTLSQVETCTTRNFQVLNIRSPTPAWSLRDTWMAPGLGKGCHIRRPQAVFAPEIGSRKHFDGPIQVGGALGLASRQLHCASKDHGIGSR